MFVVIFLCPPPRRETVIEVLQIFVGGFSFVVGSTLYICASNNKQTSFRGENFNALEILLERRGNIFSLRSSKISSTLQKKVYVCCACVQPLSHLSI